MKEFCKSLWIMKRHLVQSCRVGYNSLNEAKPCGSCDFVPSVRRWILEFVEGGSMRETIVTRHPDKDLDIESKQQYLTNFLLFKTFSKIVISSVFSGNLCKGDNLRCSHVICRAATRFSRITDFEINVKLSIKIHNI